MNDIRLIRYGLFTSLRLCSVWVILFFFAVCVCFVLSVAMKWNLFFFTRENDYLILTGTFYVTFHSQLYLYQNKLQFCYKSTTKSYSTSKRKYHFGGIFCITWKYPDFVPLHVPPCVSTELYVEAFMAFYVDFRQHITYKFSQTKMLFSTLKMSKISILNFRF